MKAYAIRYRGEWHIATLVLASEFDSRRDWSEPPVWSDAKSHSYICEHLEADLALKLPEG